MNYFLIVQSQFSSPCSTNRVSTLQLTSGFVLMELNIKMINLAQNWFQFNSVHALISNRILKVKD